MTNNDRIDELTQTKDFIAQARKYMETSYEALMSSFQLSKDRNQKSVKTVKKLQSTLQKMIDAKKDNLDIPTILAGKFREQYIEHELFANNFENIYITVIPIVRPMLEVVIDALVEIRKLTQSTLDNSTMLYTNIAIKKAEKAKDYCDEINHKANFSDTLTAFTKLTTLFIDICNTLDDWRQYIEERIQQKTYHYVDLERIEQLEKIKSSSYDLTKLIELCKELNASYTNGSLLATAMLNRAIIDHIPPIFGCNSFTEVVNNFGGAKSSSFKKQMDHLNMPLRNIADSYLHEQIRKTEKLPNKTQIDFKNDIDVLLSEVVRILN